MGGTGAGVHGGPDAARGPDPAGGVREHLRSLFAARATDRAKEVAVRLALGSRRGLILRQLLMEAVLVALTGGVLGLAGGVVVQHALSAWQPMPDIAINVPVNPDSRTYGVALMLALFSGLLLGLVPVRQVMRADQWQAIRTGMSGAVSTRRFTFRDVLLVTTNCSRATP
jgi:hypothetical protein